MENLILNRKQILLEKNKEFLFKIPVLIKPMECEFLLEVSEANVSDKEVITFNLRSTSAEFENKKASLPIKITDRVTKIALKSLGLDLQGDYLFYSCNSNKNISFSLSVIRNTY